MEDQVDDFSAGEFSAVNCRRMACSVVYITVLTSHAKSIKLVYDLARFPIEEVSWNSTGICNVICRLYTPCLKFLPSQFSRVATVKYSVYLSHNFQVIIVAYINVFVLC